MNIKKNFEKNNFRVLKSDAKVDATIIFAVTINTAPTVLLWYKYTSTVFTYRQQWWASIHLNVTERYFHRSHI